MAGRAGISQTIAGNGIYYTPLYCYSEVKDFLTETQNTGRA